MQPRIDKIVVDFISQLTANNNKTWFDANRSFYTEARSAFLQFGEAFISRVAEFDPTVGELDVKNCVFRINRDVRFSPDKSPYKRHFGLFVARGGKNSRLPGYYFHLQPSDNSVFCSGNYGLNSEELRQLRTEICNFPEELHAIVSDLPKAGLRLSDNEGKLKKLPRGFEIDERYSEYLKYKTLNAIVGYSDKEVLSENFFDTLCRHAEAAHALNDFYLRALETEVEEDYGL